jgi:hypothetical protein
MKNLRNSTTLNHDGKIQPPVAGNKILKGLKIEF